LFFKVKRLVDFPFIFVRKFDEGISLIVFVF
jgi:hypothetical protein